MQKAGTRRIETHRLILRPFTMEDAEDMFANRASDPEVTRFLTWPAHGSVEVTRMVLGSWIPQYADGGYFQWAVVNRGALAFYEAAGLKTFRRYMEVFLDDPVQED